MPETVAHRAISRFYDELWNQGALHVADEVCTDDFKFFLTFRPDPIETPAGLKALVEINRHAFPDIVWTVREYVNENSRVAAHWRMTATHVNEWMGVPAKNTPVSITGMSLFHLTDDRIAEVYVISDVFSLLQQLGVAPMLPLKPNAS